MILQFAILLLFQLAGEAVARGLGLSMPGPLLGLAGLLALMVLRPRVAEVIEPVAKGLLAHLSLLFVPVSVGVILHLDLFATQGLVLVATVVISTVLAIAVAALVFVGVLRAQGREDNA